MARAYKVPCRSCERKILAGESFCGSCGTPTEWATHDERVSWEVAQWRRAREGDKPAVHAPSPPPPRRRQRIDEPVSPAPASTAKKATAKPAVKKAAKKTAKKATKKPAVKPATRKKTAAEPAATKRPAAATHNEDLLREAVQVLRAIGEQVAALNARMDSIESRVRQRRRGWLFGRG